MRNRFRICVSVSSLLLALGLRAQQSDSGSASGEQSQTNGPLSRAATVPRLTNFSGTVKDSAGKPQTGLVGITFALFEEQVGGDPLWSEIQNVQLDEQGRYTVLLGATQPTGLPLDLFTTGKARWLGVRPELPTVSELPRILLVGVAYAMEASDADTLGGKPASAFALAGSSSVVKSEGSSVRTQAAQSAN